MEPIGKPLLLLAALLAAVIGVQAAGFALAVFVMLAFMFAVFLARPCSFYVLDEVEAALDDLNVDRFLQLVRRYSDRAQFIVVTHQKRTMEAADALYGVSMAGNGVSKVISRRLPAQREEAAA